MGGEVVTDYRIFFFRIQMSLVPDVSSDEARLRAIVGTRPMKPYLVKCPVNNKFMRERFKAINKFTRDKPDPNKWRKEMNNIVHNKYEATLIPKARMQRLMKHCFAVAHGKYVRRDVVLRIPNSVVIENIYYVQYDLINVFVSCVSLSLFRGEVAPTEKEFIFQNAQIKQGPLAILDDEMPLDRDMVAAD